MVLHLAISLISSSLIHLVDFLDPPINFYFLCLNLILKLKTYGGRSFTIAAPSVWNALPFELRSCNSLSSFRSKLKTWLFKIGYDVVV